MEIIWSPCLNRETFREWANAYRDLEGKFIKINVDDNNPTQLVKTDDATMNMLTHEQVRGKSHHFLDPMTLLL